MREKKPKDDFWDWGIALPFASKRTPNKQSKLLTPNPSCRSRKRHVYTDRSTNKSQVTKPDRVRIYTYLHLQVVIRVFSTSRMKGGDCDKEFHFGVVIVNINSKFISAQAFSFALQPLLLHGTPYMQGSYHL